MTTYDPNTFIPSTIAGGLSLSITVESTDYPAPDWVVKAYLRGPSSIDLTADASGTSHVITVSASDTAEWTAGNYWYSLRATQESEVVEIESGQLTITPDFLSQPDGYDGRTQAEIALSAIDAVLGRRATLDQSRYRINNRELYRMDIGELIKLRSFYVAQVKRERACNLSSTTFGRPVIVRFDE